MTVNILPIVRALTRGWVRLYTRRLPRPLAERRRAEIESDIWEMQHDPNLVPGPRSSAIAIARLIDGMPDDIAWWFANAASEEHLIMRRVVALVVATVLVLAVWPVPSIFINGHRDVAVCAATAPAPKTRADLQYEVIRCTGAFFSSPR